MTEISELQAKLAESRADLFTLLQGLTDEQWETAVYAEDTTWTVSDMVRHLESAERSMIALMVGIRQGGEGVPPDFDLARWNASRIQKTKGKPTSDLLAAMAENRAELLVFMASLTDEDWQKKGRHGSLNILTLAETCHVIADHETAHAKDIREALGI